MKFMWVYILLDRGRAFLAQGVTNGRTFCANLSVFFLACCMPCAWPQSKNEIRLPPTVDAAHLSSVPDGGDALVFARVAGIEPSVSTPIHLSFQHSPPIQSIKNAEVIAGTEAVAWTSDPNVALLETVTGIKRLDFGTMNVSLFIQGDTYGLAISPSKSRIAFWENAEGGYSLKVAAFPGKKVLREWRITTRYKRISRGFEIGFSDENTIYARTFDEVSKTPLKQFDVRTGAVSQIVPDCVALAKTQRGIYYIAQDDTGKSALFRLQGDTSTSVNLDGKFSYDNLLDDNNGPWLALSSSLNPGVAVLDTRSDKIIKQVDGCTSVTVRGNGRFLYSHKSDISEDPAICD